MFHKLSPIFSKTGSLKCFRTKNSFHTAAGRCYLAQDTNTSMPAHLMRQTRACGTEMKRKKNKNSGDEECNKERHFFPPQFPISLCPINLKAWDIITKCLQDVVKQRKNLILFILGYCLTFKSDIHYLRQLSSWPTRYQKPLNDFGMKSSSVKLTPFRESTKTIKRKIIGTNVLRGCNQEQY